MTKRVLITAGVVYGPLDDNKLVGNRVRGIWASRFAAWLDRRGYDVTFLVADTQRDEILHRLEASGVCGVVGNIITHKGFWDYQEKCLALASEHDAAVMAAAVVNWIPAKPIAGKMSTTSRYALLKSLGASPFDLAFNGTDLLTPGSIVDIPFILAPRVIDEMRQINPKLTLIGCKMTIGASHTDMMDAAYKTLQGAKCHAVIANDMEVGLRTKYITYADRAAFKFEFPEKVSGVFTSNLDIEFHQQLEGVILDEHFTTVAVPLDAPESFVAIDTFNRLVTKYRERFVHKIAGSDLVFGSIAVRTSAGALCSPREKGFAFTARQAVDVFWPTDDDLRNRRVRVVYAPSRATMNVTLLLRHLQKYPTAKAVVHLHEHLPDFPTVPYAPPGTVRDNLREIVGPIYNIDGHGCIMALQDP